MQHPHQWPCGALRAPPMALPEEWVPNQIPAPEEFYSAYVRERHPGLFRGLASSWVATTMANETRFQEQHGNEISPVGLREQQFVRGGGLPTKERMALRSFLHRRRKEELYLDSPLGLGMLRDIAGKGPSSS